MQDVPYGLCHCGCGERTWRATYTFPERGWVKGEPIRYRRGHNAYLKRLPEEEVARRFWAKVEKTDTCWLWMGHRRAKGHGGFHCRGVTRIAHRYAYELLVGPIPEGLQIDHLCRVPWCVNPEHLEAVTSLENQRRGLKGVLGIQRDHRPGAWFAEFVVANETDVEWLPLSAKDDVAMVLAYDRTYGWPDLESAHAYLEENWEWR